MRLAILKIPLSSGLQENVEQCITYVTFVPTSWNETVASCLLRGGIPGIYARSWGKNIVCIHGLYYRCHPKTNRWWSATIVSDIILVGGI